MSLGGPQHLTVTTTADEACRLARATGLRPDVAAACRALVAGLIVVLHDPALAVEPGSPRHVHADLSMPRPVPVGAELEVTATPVRVARLGAAAGVWIDVDVDDVDGPVLRSQHVVSAQIGWAAEPGPPLSRAPRPSAPLGDEAGLCIRRQALDDYRAAAADTSPVHGPETSIVPGLLLLLAAAAAVRPDLAAPARIAGRFSRPLEAGTAATVRSRSGPDGDRFLVVDAADRTVLRDGAVAPTGARA